jgi:hypothetical protein
MKNEQYEMVKELLTKYPEFRDSDNKLMAHVWRKDLAYNLNLMSAIDLLKKIALSDLATWGTITRYRREIQELHSELRGLKYKERQEKQDEVKAEIREIKSEFDDKFGFKPLPKEGLFQ